MGLAAKLEKEFSANSRKRGQEYFAFGSVQILEGTETMVEATVEGTDQYAVSLQWTNDALAVCCTCPYFIDQGQPCKHLWATILSAYVAGHLSATNSVEEIVLNLDLLSGPNEQDGEFTLQSPPIRGPKQVALVARPAPPSLWKTQLNRIKESATVSTRSDGPRWPTDAEVVYVLDVEKSRAKEAIVLAVGTREPKKAGGWKYLAKPYSVNRSRLESVPTEVDRQILSLMVGGQYSPYSYYSSYDNSGDSYALTPILARTLLPMVLATGRCYLPFEKTETELTKAALRWDEGAPWRLVLEVRGSSAEGWLLTGSFRRGDERLAVGKELLAIRSQGGVGFLVTNEWVGLLDVERGFAWVSFLRENGRIPVPEEEREEFLNSLMVSPHLPELELPEALRFEEVEIVPRPCLTVRQPKTRSGYSADRLEAAISFDYDGRSVPSTDLSSGVYESANNRYIRRDARSERAALAVLYEVGLRQSNDYYNKGEWTLAPSKLPKAARALAEAGWQVVADGKVFRQPGKGSVSVASGVDWFELHGEVEYGDMVARLPRLLAALKRGETMVVLDDGSYGLLPEEWLRRFANVAAMGELAGDHLQFGRSQVGLLDALLSAQPVVDCDEHFRKVRSELCRFESIGAAEQPVGFAGVLREYQREGLGWMHFLRQFNFGGCLADDMGVGKTAQVLALLETRRELRAKGEVQAPSLVVLPKSLIFNWKQEIERFTPRMRVLDYTGIARGKMELAECDLILTTYGTLRRDAVQFAEVTFDYVVLDEAQAIKNARTESAKAVRLLRGNHRLAMSGTPVENHLGELWSLFEFLNPGMLGGAGVFQMAAKEMRDPSNETRQLLAKAMRPFLLRRTKEQVAKELPAKLEQTLYCELEPKQRALYNELRQHYRDSLLGKIAKNGVAKSKIQVLEALLRLRQAACHPGLVDKKRAGDPSAKLDVLLEQLLDVIAEGHKALVFSQFTTLLGLVGSRLEVEGVAYEYLDGKTADRQVPVERFQNDPECKLFLISLKAGGVGLNLTAADYVFILDPWWNPAVEAQAVDRAHRIGQTKQVFAYRLIARDTVEEKILELQQKKRNVADAILSEDNSLIRDLGAEDIELLLS